MGKEPEERADESGGDLPVSSRLPNARSIVTYRADRYPPSSLEKNGASYARISNSGFASAPEPRWRHKGHDTLMFAGEYSVQSG